MEKISKEISMGSKFEEGTDVGFHLDEIKQNSTEDLLILRNSIYSYLKIKKLKKRNSKYMDVFIRINKELSFRKAQKNKENSEEESNRKKSSFSAQSLFEFFEMQKNSEREKENLLGYKKNKEVIHKFDFPNFLNDKVKEPKKVDFNKEEHVPKEKGKENFISSVSQLKENLHQEANNLYSGNI